MDQNTENAAPTTMRQIAEAQQGRGKIISVILIAWVFIASIALAGGVVATAQKGQTPDTVSAAYMDYCGGCINALRDLTNKKCNDYINDECKSSDPGKCGEGEFCDGGRSCESGTKRCDNGRCGKSCSEDNPDIKLNGGSICGNGGNKCASGECKDGKCTANNNNNQVTGGNSSNNNNDNNSNNNNNNDNNSNNTASCKSKGGACLSNGLCGGEEGNNVGKFDCGSNKICCVLPKTSEAKTCSGEGGQCIDNGLCTAAKGTKLGSLNCGGGGVCCKFEDSTAVSPQSASGSAVGGQCGFGGNECVGLGGTVKSTKCNSGLCCVLPKKPEKPVYTPVIVAQVTDSVLGLREEIQQRYSKAVTGFDSNAIVNEEAISLIVEVQDNVRFVRAYEILNSDFCEDNSNAEQCESLEKGINFAEDDIRAGIADFTAYVNNQELENRLIDERTKECVARKIGRCGTEVALSTPRCVADILKTCQRQ